MSGTTARRRSVVSVVRKIVKSQPARTRASALDNFRKATLPETASMPGVFRWMVLRGILLLPLLSLRMSLNFKNLLVSMYLYQMAAPLSHPPAPLRSRHLPPCIRLQLKKLRWRLQSTHPFSSHPKPPLTLLIRLLRCFLTLPQSQPNPPKELLPPNL